MKITRVDVGSADTTRRVPSTYSAVRRASASAPPRPPSPGAYAIITVGAVGTASGCAVTSSADIVTCPGASPSPQSPLRVVASTGPRHASATARPSQPHPTIARA